MGTVMETGGERLRRLILERFGTAQDFAEACDMNPQQLSRLLNGNTENAKPPTLARLASTLGVPRRRIYEELGLIEPSEESPPMELYGELAPFVAAVEAETDPQFRVRLARIKARKSDSAYARFCEQVARAWRSDLEMALSVAEGNGQS